MRHKVLDLQVHGHRRAAGGVLHHKVNRGVAVQRGRIGAIPAHGGPILGENVLARTGTSGRPLPSLVPVIHVVARAEEPKRPAAEPSMRRDVRRIEKAHVPLAFRASVRRRESAPAATAPHMGTTSESETFRRRLRRRTDMIARVRGWRHAKDLRQERVVPGDTVEALRKRLRGERAGGRGSTRSKRHRIVGQ